VKPNAGMLVNTELMMLKSMVKPLTVTQPKSQIVGRQTFNNDMGSKNESK
jgi:hypothetical protein